MIFEKFLSLLPPELDGALVMSEENRRYFTSFLSSDGALLISRNGTVFLTDSRYVEAAQKKITVCPVRLSKNLSTTPAKGLTTLFALRARRGRF